jgi:hypothetical protein
MAQSRRYKKLWKRFTKKQRGSGPKDGKDVLPPSPIIDDLSMYSEDELREQLRLIQIQLDQLRLLRIQISRQENIEAIKSKDKGA